MFVSKKINSSKNLLKIALELNFFKIQIPDGQQESMFDDYNFFV
jgi:hypothetical protein